MISRHQSCAIIAAFALLGCGGAEARPKASRVTASAVVNAGADTSAGRSDERVRRADLSRIRGDSAAKVWVVIVSDFQCPFCKLWHDSTFGVIDREYVATGKVRVAYVNFPLRRHPNAVPSAEAAMCGAAQGKFWEFHDRLFEQQDKWALMADPTPALEAIASELKLDLAAWKACTTTHLMQPMIRADYARGVQANVNSTPTFFVGNQVLEGAQRAPAMREAINKALAAAGVGTGGAK
jgi:protein-disulfide isomerase